MSTDTSWLTEDDPERMVDEAREIFGDYDPEGYGRPVPEPVVDMLRKAYRLLSAEDETPAARRLLDGYRRDEDAATKADSAARDAMWDWFGQLPEPDTCNERNVEAFEGPVVDALVAEAVEDRIPRDVYDRLTAPWCKVA